MAYKFWFNIFWVEIVIYTIINNYSIIICYKIKINFSFIQFQQQYETIFLNGSSPKVSVSLNKVNNKKNNINIHSGSFREMYLQKFDINNLTDNLITKNIFNFIRR